MSLRALHTAPQDNSISHQSHVVLFHPYKSHAVPPCLLLADDHYGGIGVELLVVDVPAQVSDCIFFSCSRRTAS